MTEVIPKPSERGEKWSQEYADRLYACDEAGGAFAVAKMYAYRVTVLARFHDAIRKLTNGLPCIEATGWSGQARVIIDRKECMVGYIVSSGGVHAYYLYPKGAVPPLDPKEHALWPWSSNVCWEFQVPNSTRVLIYEERSSRSD